MDSAFVTNPLRDSQLITPFDTRSLSSQDIQQLYRDESLTSDEYMVLEFFGQTQNLKSGEVQISFQGLKRLTQIHQAKLTKAINRLVEKTLLEKADAGYRLTPAGIDVFSRLLNIYRNSSDIFPNKVYSHVAQGQVQGLQLDFSEYERIAENLVGKWFGRFRFTSKVEYEDGIELGWVSTNGSISAALILGPDNNLRLSLSAPIYDEAQSELQILMNHLSQSIETVIDAPLIFTSQKVFENRKEIFKEIDDAIIAYAG